MKKIRRKRLILLDSVTEMQAGAGESPGIPAFRVFRGTGLGAIQYAMCSRYVSYSRDPWQDSRQLVAWAIVKRNPQPVWPSVNPDKGVRVALAEVLTMPDAKYFARKAERCRELLKLARVPEVIEQLRVWAAEFEAEGQKSARRGPHNRNGASMLRQRTRA